MKYLLCHALRWLPALSLFGLVALSTFSAAPALAHPHGFMEAKATLVFDEQGLAGIRQRWVIDPMTTWAVFELIHENGDGKLDSAEVAAIERESFGSIKDYNYFTAVLINGEPFPVEWATDFDAFMEQGKLVYTFFVPCHVAAAPKPHEIKIAIYDPSFFIFVAYVGEGGSGVDPTKDPMFADPTAPASPDDFQRFAAATGLGAFEGEVFLEGPVQKFAIQADVVDAPDMSYFYDQIVPQAFRLRFSRS